MFLAAPVSFDGLLIQCAGRVLRLPVTVLDPDTVGAYCLTDSSTAWTSRSNIIVALTRDGDGDDEFLDEDGHGRLGAIVSVRAELPALGATSEQRTSMI